MLSKTRFRSLGRLIVPVLLASAFFAGRATADQPMMHDALTHLRAAEASLKGATADKGGHRNAALSFTRKAIAQVEQGLKFDRRH